MLSDEARTALAVVDVEEEALLGTLGSLLDRAQALLVGSVPAGLGNAGSDIDIHVLVDDDRSSPLPITVFVDQTIVDVQFFDRAEARALIDGLGTTSIRLGAMGPISLRPPLSVKVSTRLSRWTNSVPLLADRPDHGLPTAADVEVILPVLARRLLSNALRGAAVAKLADGTPGAAEHWRRAAELAFALQLHWAGSTYIGEKWIWKKARLAGAAPELMRQITLCTNEAQWREILLLLGLEPVDPYRFIAVAQTPGDSEVTINGVSYRRRGDLLFEDFDPENVTALPSSDMVELLVAGALDISIDEDEVTAWLNTDR